MSAILRVVEPEATDLSLDELAETIKREIATAKRRSMEATEAYLAAGRCLADARSRFPSDREYGQWRKAQRFGLNQQRCWVLVFAAEHERAIRALLTSQLVGGRRLPNIETAVDDLRKLQAARNSRPTWERPWDIAPWEWRRREIATCHLLLEQHRWRRTLLQRDLEREESRIAKLERQLVDLEATPAEQAAVR